MGAWIETVYLVPPRASLSKLLPLWEHGLKQLTVYALMPVNQVAPFMGAWIETGEYKSKPASDTVAPFMGAWIETLILGLICVILSLLPLWEHGLKPKKPKDQPTRKIVAPFMGAWIETAEVYTDAMVEQVAPFMGAWIETAFDAGGAPVGCGLLPLWEHGLMSTTI